MVGVRVICVMSNVSNVTRYRKPCELALYLVSFLLTFTHKLQINIQTPFYYCLLQPATVANVDIA